jgi:hypothetical protein
MMRMYYFHLRRNGKVLLDPDGRMFASPDEACRAGVFEAREAQSLCKSTLILNPISARIVEALHTIGFDKPLRNRPDTTLVLSSGSLRYKSA